MFRKLNSNRKGQNTAEYALLISLVIAAIIAMQTYAQRALQGRIRDAGVYLQGQTAPLGTTVQFEPGYLVSNYAITRNAQENVKLGNAQVAMNEQSNRTRGTGGFQEQNYTGILE